MSGKLFGRGLAASYLAIGANVIYSLVSVPLALHFLGKEGFGAWALILQVVLFLEFLDLGISHGVARILIDARGTGEYSKALATGSAAQIVVGLAVVAGGACVAPFLPYFAEVTAGAARELSAVAVVVATAAGMGVTGRIYAGILYAHKRQDLLALSHVGLFAVYLAAMGGGFLLGWGLYAMAFSYACGTLWSVLFAVLAVKILGLAPPRRKWGTPSLEIFQEMFAFGRRTFLMGVGGSLLMGSPVFIVTRLLGLDAAAAWAVCLKPFQILLQILSKPVDVAMPFLAEQFANGNAAAAGSRLLEIMRLTAAMAAGGCVAFAALNPGFIALWTGGKISVPYSVHWGMGFMVAVWSLARIITGAVGVTKQFGIVPWMYFLEAAGLVLLSLAAVPAFGMAAIPLAAAGLHLLLSFPVGMRLATESLGIHLAKLANALCAPLGASFLLALFMATVFLFVPVRAPSWVVFFLQASVFAAAASIACLLALGPELRSTLKQRLGSISLQASSYSRSKT